ncbi:hypothetical protein NQ315_000402 [Exocentrus adspersus]|uniref:Uncharacterized protein n=1 Tax=Exocentrus adspersus TaxID=1586481 RepID=A0AAV8VLW4_9CUCU|nr:hypothetical protein NQ315_000402 [Exocentrus adspersus]
MSNIKLLAVLVVALFVQIGEAQNFHYINEIQHGHDYNYNSSDKHFSSISVVLCSLILSRYLGQIPALLLNRS